MHRKDVCAAEKKPIKYKEEGVYFKKSIHDPQDRYARLTAENFITGSSMNHRWNLRTAKDFQKQEPFFLIISLRTT